MISGVTVFCIVTYRMLGWILSSLQLMWTEADEEESVQGVEVMIIIVTIGLPIYRIAEADPQGKDTIAIVIVTVQSVAYVVPMDVDMFVVIWVIVLKDKAVIRKAAAVIRESKATMTIPSNQDRVGDNSDDNFFHAIFFESFPCNGDCHSPE